MKAKFYIIEEDYIFDLLFDVASSNNFENMLLDYKMLNEYEQFIEAKDLDDYLNDSNCDKFDNRYYFISCGNEDIESIVAKYFKKEDYVIENLDENNDRLLKADKFLADYFADMYDKKAGLYEFITDDDREKFSWLLVDNDELKKDDYKLKHLYLFYRNSNYKVGDNSDDLEMIGYNNAKSGDDYDFCNSLKYDFLVEIIELLKE